ncbi:MAG TPA: hypothetical protein VF753_21000, partial [Terriglobales bacterium]
VTNIDIAIPPPPGQPQAAAEPPPTSNPEGKALAAKVVQAMGGLARLQAVKALRAEFNEQEPEGGGTNVEVTIQFPDQMHVGIATPQGPMTIVVTPTAGFMVPPGGGVQNLPDSAKAESLQQIHRDLVYVGQHLDDPSFIFSSGGTEKVGGLDAQVLDVSGSGSQIRWLIDPATGRIVREKYQANGPSGPFEGETDLEDWKDTNGITLPALHKNRQNGKLASTVETTKLEFNPTVDPKLFERPAN